MAYLQKICSWVTANWWPSLKKVLFQLETKLFKDGLDTDSFDIYPFSGLSTGI